MALARECDEVVSAFLRGQLLVMLALGFCYTLGLMLVGLDLALLIGGADGFAPEVRARADLSWSLSRLTLPHALVRVVLAEQLYRAHSVLSGHPYHRA